MLYRKITAAALISAALFAGTVLSASGQSDGTALKPFAVHPEGHGGRDLTMEEVILSRDIYPSRIRPEWKDNNSFIYREGREFRIYDISAGESRPAKPEMFRDSILASMMAALPAEAENPAPAKVAIPGGTGYNAVAYTVGRSLYYIDRNLHKYLIAGSIDRNITYGQSVSRNEFGINEGIYWAPDGKHLVFYRKDEKEVTDFPLLDITSRTGTLELIKYPMNGMGSENVRAAVYDLAADRTVYLDTDDFGYDQYLTNVSWSPDSRHVFIQVLDRTQKHMRLNMYNASDGTFEKTILTEDNDRYVEPLNRLQWLSGTSKFIYRTDNRNGYRNLYLCDTLGNIDRLTCTDADVSFIAENGKSVFYTSAEVSPVENHLYRIDVSISGKGKVKIGNPVRLTPDEGWHEISMNADCSWFVDSYSSFNNPGTTRLRSADGRTERTLRECGDPLEGYNTGEMTLGTVKSADGKYDNWFRLIKPAGFDPAKKYPVILYVYGGPHSQMVNDSWLGQIRMWEMYMAERGYVVYVQDNRGTENRGAEYEKAIHRHCGQAEMADQMVGINALRALPYVDADRIGVHGWSYGGFMTISLMTNYPETFKVGVAGGPVIDWKWYEVMYGERYMDTEAVNPEGFAQTSLINKAKDLKGKLLICQGAVDNTVVWEHSLSFIRECIKNNVQVDYFPYPCAQHNVFGRDRIHLMDKVTMYFEDYLK